MHRDVCRPFALAQAKTMAGIHKGYISRIEARTLEGFASAAPASLMIQSGAYLKSHPLTVKVMQTNLLMTCEYCNHPLVSRPADVSGRGAEQFASPADVLTVYMEGNEECCAADASRTAAGLHPIALHALHELQRGGDYRLHARARLQTELGRIPVQI